MSFLLSLIVLGLLGALFYYPIDPLLIPNVKIAALAVAGLLALLQLVGLFRGGSAKSAEAPAASAKAEPEELPGPSRQVEVDAEVVQFLARLQEKGRLVDFVMDDITPYSNEQIGAAARVVHQGCKEVLQGCFEIAPVHGGAEQEGISLAGDFDATAYRLVGKVPEQPPYNGTVLHRGWKTTGVNLPRLTREAIEGSAREVIAPAEIEIS